MMPSLKALSYTIFKKELIKFVKSVSIAFEVLWGAVGWVCLIVFALRVVATTHNGQST
jgi:tellurite resistance protein TehA-like permease